MAYFPEFRPMRSFILQNFRSDRNLAAPIEFVAAGRRGRSTPRFAQRHADDGRLVEADPARTHQRRRRAAPSGPSPGHPLPNRRIDNDVNLGLGDDQGHNCARSRRRMSLVSQRDRRHRHPAGEMLTCCRPPRGRDLAAQPGRATTTGRIAKPYRHDRPPNGSPRPTGATVLAATSAARRQRIVVAPGDPGPTNARTHRSPPDPPPGPAEPGGCRCLATPEAASPSSAATRTDALRAELGDIEHLSDDATTSRAASPAADRPDRSAPRRPGRRAPANDRSSPGGAPCRPPPPPVSRRRGRRRGRREDRPGLQIGHAINPTSSEPTPTTRSRSDHPSPRSDHQVVRPSAWPRSTGCGKGQHRVRAAAPRERHHRRQRRPPPPGTQRSTAADLHLASGGSRRNSRPMRWPFPTDPPASSIGSACPVHVTLPSPRPGSRPPPPPNAAARSTVPNTPWYDVDPPLELPRDRHRRLETTIRLAVGAVLVRVRAHHDVLRCTPNPRHTRPAHVVPPPSPIAHRA